MRRSRGSLAATCAAVLCGTFLAACGGTSSDTGGGGGSACTAGSCPVGTGGGTVSLPGGPTVVVPSGALPGSTAITVATSTTTAPAGAVSSLYQFGPAGTTFTAPVTVSFPVPAGTKAADVAVYWTKPGSTTEWDVLPATVSGATASASVTHFSTGFVGAACSVGTSCTPANACNAGVTTCNGTPACVDTGTAVADGTACGSGNVCTAGACTALACTPIADTFTRVPEVRVASASPAPLGGTLVDGVYDLTANTIYTGPGGLSGTQPGMYAGILVISGGTLQEVMAYSLVPSQPVTPRVLTYSLAGTTYTITSSVCGGAEVGYTLGYTATATELRFLPNGGTSTGRSLTYTLRGSSTCTAGQACTPTGTADLCKTYATTCGTGGVQSCGASGNQPDGTSCGSGLTCQAGTCLATGPSTITVTGRVVDLWNFPQSGKRIQIVGVPGARVTDAAGAFTFSGVTPPYRLVLDDHTTRWDDWEVWDGLTRPDPVLSTGHYTQAIQRSASVTVTVSGGAPGASTLAFLTSPRSRHADVLYAVPSFVAPSGTVSLAWMGDATLTADLHLVQVSQGVVTAYAKVGSLALTAGQSHQAGAALEPVVSDPLSSIVTGSAVTGLDGTLVLDGDWVYGTTVSGSSPLSVSMPRIPGAQIAVRYNYTNGEGCVLLSAASVGPIAVEPATGATLVSPAPQSVFDAATDTVSWSPISPIQPPGAVYSMKVGWSQGGKSQNVTVNTEGTSFRLSSLAGLTYPIPAIPSGTPAYVGAGAETGLAVDDLASTPGLWCPRNTRYGVASVPVTAK